MLSKTEAGERIERALEAPGGWRSSSDVEIRILAEKLLAAGQDEEVVLSLIGELVRSVANHCGAAAAELARREAGR